MAQVLCLGRQRPRLRRCADHLHRHGEIELDLRSCGRGVFLASVLFAPAGSQLRQSARARGGARGDAVLARSRRGRIPARRGSLPGRARRNGLREPPGDARDHQAHPRRPRPDRPRLHAARRGQPVAGRRAGVFRRGRRVPHGVPLPADAAHVHGDRPGGPFSDHRHPAPDAGDSARRVNGRSSCATTTS